jgi:ubiquinone/menaquinone biosynthesis C-methylase UbiE
MPMTALPAHHEWEAAERHRSRIEASLTARSGLVANHMEVGRYLGPSLDTVFPLEYAFALLGDIRGRSVLDFGCGSGENAFLLATRGARVVGLDISASLIALARERLEVNGVAGIATFVVGSAHDVPVADASVDVVFGNAVLHHLDLKATAREVYRVLKPGGRAIFQEPVRDSRLVRAVRKWIPYQAPDISPFERPLTTPELNEFGSRFVRSRMRAFALPFVSAAQVVPPLRRFVHDAYAWDAKILRRVPQLTPFAGIRVVEFVKAA